MSEVLLYSKLRSHYFENPGVRTLQGNLAHKKTPPTLGPPSSLRHSHSVGPWGEAFPHE